MCVPPSNQLGLNCLHSSFYVVSRAICKPGLQLLFRTGRFKGEKSAMFGFSRVQQFDVMSAITAVFVFLLLLLILMEHKPSLKGAHHNLLYQSV